MRRWGYGTHRARERIEHAVVVDIAANGEVDPFGVFLLQVDVFMARRRILRDVRVDAEGPIEALKELPSSDGSAERRIAFRANLDPLIYCCALSRPHHGCCLPSSPAQHHRVVLRTRYELHCLYLQAVQSAEIAPLLAAGSELIDLQRSVTVACRDVAAAYTA